jgi:hypothetical protein
VGRGGDRTGAARAAAQVQLTKSPLPSVNQINTSKKKFTALENNESHPSDKIYWLKIKRRRRQANG